MLNTAKDGTVTFDHRSGSTIALLHRESIEGEVAIAENLGLLESNFRRKLFTQAGIVCRYPQSKGFSIKNSYYGLYSQYRQNDVDTRTRTIHNLLQSVLATHLSILLNTQEPEMEEDATALFVAQLQKLEEFLREEKLPSIRQFLFDPISLARQFTSIEWQDFELQKRKEALHKLADVVLTIDFYFKAVGLELIKTRNFDLANEWFAISKDYTSLSHGEMLAKHPMFLEYYIETLQREEKYEELLYVLFESSSYEGTKKCNAVRIDGCSAVAGHFSCSERVDVKRMVLQTLQTTQQHIEGNALSYWIEEYEVGLED